MRKLALLSALSVISLSVYASQRQSAPHNQAVPQYVKDMKSMLQNATAAEVDTSETSLPDVDTTSGGTADSYCQATLNSQGNAAAIGYGGSLNLAQSTFALSVTGQILHPNGFGMFTFGTAPYNVPFANGYLCISPFGPGGIQRMPVQALSQPTLILAMEDASGQFAQLTPGATWYFQFWYRDPNAGGSNFNLSNGLHVVFAGP
jgi:hypothetical protein